MAQIDKTLNWPDGLADEQILTPAATVNLTVSNMLTYVYFNAALALNVTLNFLIDGQMRQGARVVVRALSDATARNVTPGTGASGVAVVGVISKTFEIEFEYKRTGPNGALAFVLINARQVD
jgi:hypothetical protein